MRPVVVSRVREFFYSFCRQLVRVTAPVFTGAILTFFMKLLYTILFLLDTLALVLLMYLFLELSDTGTGEIALMGLLCLIVICIVFLVHVLLRFVHLPGKEGHR